MTDTLNAEINHLLDLMPASGRMYCQLVSAPGQTAVISARLPLPWQQTRPIAINFERWTQLSRPQRDLALLRAVSWVNGVQWLKPNFYQGVAIAGVVGSLWEFSQGNALGAIVAGGITTVAGTQLWRSHTGSQRELEADDAAMRVAEWRGYAKPDAARYLREAIEAIANLEGRSLTVVELLRCQQLRAIANL